ncbi:MAG: Amuc_1100 family pilus-like protein [Verrucomicrobiota bacterium]
MSWIKDNKFMAGLGGGTLAGAILLYVVGSHFSKDYDAAKEQFDAAASEAASFEKLPLYPKPENKDQKSKALGDYVKTVESIQTAFAPFRPKEIKNVKPQEFTDHLLAANTEVRKAFEEAGTVVPEAFFMGFEKYKTTLAPGNTTGVLDYQLGGIKTLMLALAKAKPSELKNIYRPLLPEDEGQVFAPPATMTARPFPLEVTFIGPEKAAREFMSSIVKQENQYFVVRSMRVSNMKKDPPRAADAQFDKAPAKPAAASDPFAGGFVLPGDEQPAAAPATPAVAETPAAPAPKAADSSRILSQVLGNEQVQVFLRLDLLQFLPAKKLP